MDGYLEVLAGKIPRKDAVKRVSHDLRQMAVRQGMDIDDIYRNENGIHFQMRSMESAWQGHTVSSKPATRLFLDVVAMYRDNRLGFDALLSEAKAMVTAEDSSVSTNSSKQPKWNKYEAAILLDGYLEVFEGKSLRKDVVRRVSKDLRQMALNHGMEINDIFRNEKGIYFQIGSMASAYQGHTIYQCASRLFSDVAKLYKNNRSDFDALLNEARALVAPNFMHPAEDMSKRQPSWNKYEAAILLDGYLDVFERKDSRLQAVSRVSRDLRQMAVNQGIQVDEVYRNEKGIYSQMMRMESAYQGHTVNLCATELFTQVAELYWKHRPDYDALLNDAKAMIKTDNKDADGHLSQNNEENNLKEKQSDSCSSTEQDSRLLHKYPDTYKRVLAALKELTESNDEGVSAVSVYEHIDRSGRCADIEDILDNASWSKEAGKGYRFYSESERLAVEPSYEPVVVSAIDSGSNDETFDRVKVKTVDFNHIGSLAFTEPLSISFGGKVTACKTWPELYVVFFSALYKDHSQKFVQKPMSFANGGHADLGTESDAVGMTEPKHVPDTDLYLETDLSATSIAMRIKTFMDRCTVGYENTVIKYRDISRAGETTGSTTSGSENSDEFELSADEPDKRFYSYLHDNLRLAETSCRSYVSAIRSCEKFAAEHGYASKQFYGADLANARSTVAALLADTEFLEFNAQQRNRLKITLEKYLAFLTGNAGNAADEDSSSSDMTVHKEEYEAVLKEYFSNGFRLGSAIVADKFRKYYVALHGRELEDSYDVIEQTVRQITIVYNKKTAYLPQSMATSEIRGKILAFIEDNFSRGKKCVYYDAIFSELSTDFLDCHIYDTDMLRMYLAYINEGRFYLGRSSISRDPGDTANPAEEVREFMIEAGRPVSYDEIYAALAHLPKERIRSILGSNSEFINNAPKCFFHQSCMHITDEELEDISALVALLIDEKEYISGNELYMAVKEKYPYIIENNAGISVYGFRDALKYSLGSRFSFIGNIISRNGQAMTMQDVFADFCKGRHSFTLDELSVFAKEMGTQVTQNYLKVVYENSLRVSRTQFVSKDRAAFRTDEIDSALDLLCAGSYVGVSKVGNSILLPETEFPWNGFLLQHYVYEYSKKYKLVHNGLNANSCDGAIVKKSSGIDTFDDLVTRALADSDINLNSDAALQYLCDEGFLARHRLSSIEHILIKANALRNNNKNKGA